jgi:hypothetical protein
MLSVIGSPSGIWFPTGSGNASCRHLTQADSDVHRASRQMYAAGSFCRDKTARALNWSLASMKCRCLEYMIWHYGRKQFFLLPHLRHHIQTCWVTVATLIDWKQGASQSEPKRLETGANSPDPRTQIYDALIFTSTPHNQAMSWCWDMVTTLPFIHHNTGDRNQKPEPFRISAIYSGVLLFHPFKIKQLAWGWNIELNLYSLYTRLHPFYFFICEIMPLANYGYKRRSKERQCYLN